MSRNESIRRSIQSGEIPILPFERERAEQSFSTLVKLQHGRIFDYETDGTEVSLGSIVDIQYGHGGEIITTMLTGMTHDVEELFPDGDEVEGVTITSPVGQAILGLSPGDSTEIVVNGRKLFLNISDVRPFTEIFD